MLVKPLILTALVSFTLLAGSTAFATTLEKTDFKDLVQDASACVVAKTKSIEYAMENGAPVTKTTFTVIKAAFGSTPETITVTTAGGHLANAKVPMGEVNAGAPRFFNGTSNVLLLDEISAGNYKVTGYSQGVFDAFEQENQLVVRLPESQGGVTPLETALETINNARSDAPQLIEE